MSVVEVDPLAVLDKWVRAEWVPQQVVERIGGEWVLLACEGCGHIYKMTARSYRSYIKGERTGLCSFCLPNKGRQEKLTVTNEHRIFWRKLFTMEEIVEIATLSWGEPSEWGADWRDGFDFC